MPKNGSTGFSLTRLHFFVTDAAGKSCIENLSLVVSNLKFYPKVNQSFIQKDYDESVAAYVEYNFKNPKSSLVDS